MAKKVQTKGVVISPDEFTYDQLLEERKKLVQKLANAAVGNGLSTNRTEWLLELNTRLDAINRCLFYLKP